MTVFHSPKEEDKDDLNYTKEVDKDDADAWLVAFTVEAYLACKAGVMLLQNT
jgi:hypothetical protein